MPRRKRITGQNERRRKVRRKDGNDDEDNMLIISDSESDEEEEDCAVKLTPRAARRLGRERKVQVQEMTEEEMLDLALRLSKQEASSASGSERVEDDTLKKAISESLQVKSDTVRCSSQASETIAKEPQTRTVEKPDPDRDTVTSHVRCKLSFPSKDGKGSQSDDKVPDEQTSPLKLFEKASPLRPMPDLSQKTSSQPSPPSPTLPFVPSQEFQSSCLVKQEPESSSEDESSQSGPELLKSPVFLRNCSVRLNHVSCSNTSSFSVTNLDCSPNSPLPPKSPVFPKTDSKQCTKLTRDTFSDCGRDGSFTDSATSPNSIQVSTSHENRNFSTRLSHSKKAQLSAGVPVPADDGQEAVKLQQGTEESSQATSAHTALVADGAPNSNMPSSADDKSLNEFTSHMILYLSDNNDDDDDDDDDVNEQIIFPSPVFPQDRSSHKAQPKLSPMLPCCPPPAAVTSKYSFQTRLPSQADSEQPEVSIKSADTRLAPTVEKKEEHLVSYYWGIPFCPKGQSPDDYTRVILTQLEVYEKSLKEAQRQLLHKADWGLPVFPCPIERRHNRRLKRHRVPKLMEEDEEEEEQEKDSEELKEKKKDEKEESQCLEEGAENSQQETYVVVSSPETQEELERKAPLSFVQQGSTHSAKPSSRRNPVVEVLSEDILRRSLPGEHGDEVQNGSFDVENTVCPESQMTEDNTPELMVTSPVQAESDIMEVDEMMEPAAEAAERMEQERPGEEQSWGESVPSQVECPMCTRLFPLSKVEIHAAYCDGTVEDQDQQDNLLQGNTRRMGMRRTPIEDVRFEKSQQQEKCFLCSKFFSSKEYSSHVDQCIQQKTTKQGNGLLSALSRMETAHLDDSGAGPSNTANKTSCGPTDAPMRPGVSVVPEAQGYYVSTSPIKSFTPISELTDCVINFRQQYSDRTNQRLGRKRKFKR